MIDTLSTTQTFIVVIITTIAITLLFYTCLSDYDCSKENFDPKKKMLIMDLDNTISIPPGASEYCEGKLDYSVSPNWPSGGGTTATVKQIIQKAIDRGYGIAIATAESGSESINPQQKKFLKSINPVFDEEFFNTPNFQNTCKTIKTSNHGKKYCQSTEFPDKTAAYINIMNYNNISPSDYKYSLVIDDDYDNLDTARELGFRVCPASIGCSGKYCPDKACAMPRACLHMIE